MRFTQAFLTVAIYYAVVLATAWVVLELTDDPKR